jgi:hypothetical protein
VENLRKSCGKKSSPQTPHLMLSSALLRPYVHYDDESTTLSTEHG